MGLADFERRLLAVVLDWLVRFIDAAREAILSFARRFGTQPNPSDIFISVPVWSTGVDRIVDELEDLAGEARDREWESLLGVGRNPPGPVSSDTFIMMNLAHSRNLLVRIPDEVYQLVFAEITDGINDGESVPELVARIDAILATTGSERWVNRARVIAITEANRASNAGTLSAGMQAQQIEQIPMSKEWVATNDTRVRDTHREADRQRVPLNQPFQVGVSALMFPGDPAGHADEVVGCRCALTIHGAGDGE
jgi:hypothetical protein